MSVSFTKACNDFFGRKPDQSIMQFRDELRALDAADREYFRREFVKVGITVDAAV